jgi:hypothetical protein
MRSREPSPQVPKRQAQNHELTESNVFSLTETRLEEPSMSTVVSRKRLRAADEVPPASMRT